MEIDKEKIKQRFSEINESLKEILRKMAKFRNKLIHHYWEIEDEKILEYSRKDLGDFNEFIKAVDKILNGKKEK